MSLIQNLLRNNDNWVDEDGFKIDSKECLALLIAHFDAKSEDELFKKIFELPVLILEKEGKFVMKGHFSEIKEREHLFILSKMGSMLIKEIVKFEKGVIHTPKNKFKIIPDK